MAKHYGIPETRELEITVTEFRRCLAHYVNMVAYGGDSIAIRRKGKEPVYLVSCADFGFIQSETYDMDFGKKHPDKPGRAQSFWSKMNIPWRMEQIDAIREWRRKGPTDEF